MMINLGFFWRYRIVSKKAMYLESFLNLRGSSEGNSSQTPKKLPIHHADMR
jgi:hypothetical protein